MRLHPILSGVTIHPVDPGTVVGSQTVDTGNMLADKIGNVWMTHSDYATLKAELDDLPC